MSSFERLTLILSAISVLGIPTLWLVWRISRGWARFESNHERLVADVHQIAADNAAAHEDLDERVEALERSGLAWYTRDPAAPQAPPGRQHTGRHSARYTGSSYT